MRTNLVVIVAKKQALDNFWELYKSLYVVFFELQETAVQSMPSAFM